MTRAKLKHQYQLHQQQSPSTELICNAKYAESVAGQQPYLTDSAIEISCESSVSIDVEHNTASLYVATIYLVF